MVLLGLVNSENIDVLNKTSGHVMKRVNNTTVKFIVYTYL